MVGTRSKEGLPNLGLFNSIFHVGANPALIGFVIRPEGPDHDTLNNIMETGIYTLNSVSEAFYISAHKTSARYPSRISEFGPCGFHEEYSEKGMGPYVSESPIRIGLKMEEMIPVPINGTRILIGSVMEVHISQENILDLDGFIDPEKARGMSSVGLDAYYLPKKISRLSFAKPYSEPDFLKTP